MGVSPTPLAQLTPLRYSELSGAEHHISSCCVLSKVTESLEDGETEGEIAVLWPLTGYVTSSVVCSGEHWVWC